MSKGEWPFVAGVPLVVMAAWLGIFWLLCIGLALMLPLLFVYLVTVVYYLPKYFFRRR